MEEKELLQQLVNTSNSLSEILRKQGKAKSGASFKVLKEKLKAYGINYAFMPVQYVPKAIPLEQKLQLGTNVKSQDLKNLLIKKGLKEDKCEICGQLPEWNGQPLVLQLDHINGDHYDNRIENLRIVCPNCHTQTDTFCTKKPKNKCIDCGKEISRKSIRCQACSAKHNRKLQTRSDKPTKEELYELIKIKTYKEIAKMYGNTETAIRKWCRNYGLPNKTALRKIIQSENSTLISN